MKLWLNRTSPFARWVRIVIMEKGLEAQVELIWCDPWDSETPLLEINPLSRIPSLQTEAGHMLCESLLIALHLEDQYPEQSLLAADHKPDILHQLGLASGLMEASFSNVIAVKNEGSEAEASLMYQRRSDAIERVLTQLEQQIPSIENHLSLGDIALVVALDYIHFRLPALTIAERFPQLEHWRSHWASRNSFTDTAFS